MNDSEKKNKSQQTLIGIAIAVGIILLVFIAFILGSSIKSNSNHSSNSNSAEKAAASVYDKRIQENIPSGADDAADVNTTPVPIKLSNGSLKEFENYISLIDVDYDYEDTYIIDEALAIYNDNTVNSVTKHSHDIRINGKFDADHFYELVKSNNKKYLEEKKKSHLENFLVEYSDQQLKNICRQMMEALPAIAKKDPNVDVDTVCCYLHNLVIMGQTGSLSFGGFDMNKRFYLNYNWLEKNPYGMDTDDLEQTIFYHEMMHAYQFACDDMKKSGENRMGITHMYDELEINPLSWYWLLEGSAEMNMSQHLDVRYSTYKSLIRYIDTLNFVSNVGADNTLVQTEKICFQRDLEKLFEQFSMTSKEDRIELIKAMFSLEITLYDTDEFNDWYKKAFGVDLTTSGGDEETYVKMKVKEDAMLTLTKIFYRNLARQVNSGDATLQDVYYLMRIWEADLDRHFSNNTIGNMEFFHNFYDTYLELQEEFFEIIADENSLSDDEITENFENYSMNATNKSPNCDLKFLNAESKNYITTDFVDSFYMKGYPSMSSCQKQAEELDEEYPLENMFEDKDLD